MELCRSKARIICLLHLWNKVSDTALDQGWCCQSTCMWTGRGVIILYLRHIMKTHESTKLLKVSATFPNTSFWWGLLTSRWLLRLEAILLCSAYPPQGLRLPWMMPCLKYVYSTTIVLIIGRLILSVTMDRFHDIFSMCWARSCLSEIGVISTSLVWT